MNLNLIGVAWKRLVFGILNAIISVRSHRAARRLADAENQTERAISLALRKAAGAEPLSNEEKILLERIEQLRWRLADSRIEITVRDSVQEVGSICRNDALPPAVARILFALIRAVRPSVCIELGTSLGISCAVQSAALSLNGCGHIHTFESASALAARADDNLRSLGYGPDIVTVWPLHFQGPFPAALIEACACGGTGFAFIDADHRGDRLIDNFKRISSIMPRPIVVVIDDIRWSGSMFKAWRSIASDAQVGPTIDLFRLGLVVVR
jgi:predicted O-methyltransferase YrrM